VQISHGDAASKPGGAILTSSDPTIPMMNPHIQLDCMDVSLARLGSPQCERHCSLDVGRVIDCYEYELPFQHDSSEFS
jgi:hypothetical protein